MSAAALEFLFIDDSHHPKTRSYSLTGILVPLGQYKAVRDAFYAIAKPLIEPSAGVINPHSPEMHGCDLLRDHPDEEKFRVLSAVVDIVNRHELRCIRVDIPESVDLRRVFKTNDQVYGYCWFEFVWRLQDTLATSMIVPVMDDCAKERATHFSGLAQQFEVMRAIGREQVLSVRNTENLIGEVLYADSRYASMIQLVDMVSYLLTALDVDDAGVPPSPFRHKLVAIGRGLESRRCERHHLRLTVQDGLVRACSG